MICAQVKALADQFYQEQDMFLVSLVEGLSTAIMTYGAITKVLYMQLQHESELEDKGQLLSFWDITDHRIIKGSNSCYEVLVNWEYRSVTWVPMSVMRRDDPIYLSGYVHDNDLIDKPGWKHLRSFVKNTKNMKRLLKAAKADQQSNTVKIKFGLKIPRDHKEAMTFVADNGNTNWKYDELLELNQIYNLYFFESLGPVSKAHIPPAHTKIQVHMI